MYPTLFHIGPLVIHTYGVFVAIGFIAGFKVLLNYTERIGIPAQKVESLVMWIFIFSIIGARLFYVVLTFGLTYCRLPPHLLASATHWGFAFLWILSQT